MGELGKQTEHAGRPIRFPELTSFADFFPELGTEARTLWETESWEAGTWSDRRRETVFQVGSYVSVSGRTLRDGHHVQRIPDFLRDFIRDNMLHTSNDRTSFKVIPWNDGRALVLIEYGMILGSRYLGIIDADTIPA